MRVQRNTTVISRANRDLPTGSRKIGAKKDRRKISGLFIVVNHFRN